MTAYTYNSTLQEGMTFSTMITLALSKQGGPQPACKQPIDVQVHEGQGVAVPIDGTTKRYVAVSLLSCAAVIFASAQSTTAYLYHAPSGMVSDGAFDRALAELGPVPMESVDIIYTFPKPSDNNYLADAGSLARYGIPAANIIYAPKLALPAFGITAQTILG